MTFEQNMDPDALLEETRARLVRAAADRKSPWRTPVLATLGVGGAPQARTVVLRSFDPIVWRFRIFSDHRAEKIGEIAAAPAAALTFWDSRRLLQLRVNGTARVLDRDGAAAVWAALSAAARSAYHTQPPPATPIGAAHAYQSTPDGDADDAQFFAVVDVHAEKLDVLALDADGHRRMAARSLFNASGMGADRAERATAAISWATTWTTP